MRTLRIMKQMDFLCINVRITFQTVKEIVNMRYDGIKKIHDGKFISRYDITYTTEENKTKVYEIISRNKNITSIADLKNPSPDGVVIVVTDTKGEKLLLNKAARELKEETGLELVSIKDTLFDSYSAIGFSNETNRVVIGMADGTFSKSTSAVEEISAAWYTKAEIRELLKNNRFAARTQAFCYMWAKNGD